MAEGSAQARRNDWWRTVLGEYPTGVSLITSRDAQGDDLAMIVGTFSAVSADPPMISFMPTVGSTSFAAIRERGRFSVSVLGSGHEQLCRLFARKHPDRFASGDWAVGAGGIKRLADAVVWFDAEIETIMPAGDHEIVLARVHDFGAGNGDAGLPMLYLRGGYGTFAVPSLQFDVQGLSWQLRLSDLLRPEIESFAFDSGLECILTGLAGDSVVVLSASNPTQRSLTSRGRQPVGAAFPFAAPLGATFAAWGDEERMTSWIENSRHVLGEVDREALAALVDSVRARGYSTMAGHRVAEQFESIFEDNAPARSSVVEFWGTVSRLDSIGAPGEQLSAEELRELDSVQLPIFGPDGSTVLVLSVGGLGGELSDHELGALIHRLTAFAETLSRKVAVSGLIPGE